MMRSYTSGWVIVVEFSEAGIDYESNPMNRDGSLSNIGGHNDLAEVNRGRFECK